MKEGYHSQDNIAYAGLLYWQGQILERQAIAQTFLTHPGLNGMKIPPEMIGCESLQQRKNYFIQDSGINPITSQLDFVANELVPSYLP